MKTLKLTFALIMIIGLSSCSKKGSEGNPDENSGGGAGSVKEFIAGSVRNNQRREPVLWQDGEMLRLPFESSQNTVAKEVTVVGNDVYILGHETSPNNFIRTSRIVIWKNGVMIPVTDGSKRAAPLKMIVDNNNVYILGTETDQSQGSGTALYKYWKNGVATALNTLAGDATDMAIVNNDVYISGSEVGANNRKIAKYWKNGTAVLLSDGTRNAYGESISVEGTTVAVLLNQENSASTGNDLKVWKNNVQSILSSGNFYSFGKKIILKNNIAHVLANQRPGNSSDKVVYWRDGVKTDISTGAQNAVEKDMQLIGDDIYILFEENGPSTTSVKLAKNGTVKTLSTTAEFYAATSFSVVNGIEYVTGNVDSRALLWKNGQEKNIDLNGSTSGIFIRNN